MKLQDSQKFDLEEAKKSIEEIAEENEFLALATVSENCEALTPQHFLLSMTTSISKY